MTRELTMTPEVLGQEEWQSAWRIRARLTLQQVLDLRRELIAFVNMTADGAPDVRHYPNELGAGGQGSRFTSPSPRAG